MKALILGLVVIIVAVLAVMPAGLGWKDDVLVFLKGSLPVVAVLIGLLLVFTGITDVKDGIDSRKNKEKP